MDIYAEITEEIENMKIDKKSKKGPKLYKLLLLLSMLDYHLDCGDETNAFNNPTPLNKIVDFFTIYLENVLIQERTYSDKSNSMAPKIILKTLRENPAYHITNTITGAKSKFFFNDLPNNLTKKPRRNDTMATTFEIRVPEDTDLEKMANTVRDATVLRIKKESDIYIASSIVVDLRQNIDIEDKESLVAKTHRVGQGQYRRKMMEKYSCKCAFCNFGVEHTLVSSHARPWIHCETVLDKLSEHNGFLLCSNHDKMFDRGFLTVNPYTKKFIFSEKLDENEKLECITTLPSDMLFQHDIDDMMIPYLTYHAERVLK